MKNKGYCHESSTVDLRLKIMRNHKDKVLDEISLMTDSLKRIDENNSALHKSSKGKEQ